MLIALKCASTKATLRGIAVPETEKIQKVKKIPVIEVFGPTIQGEGALCGVRTSFIRFGLCDYRCTMCDSMHAVDPRRVKETATWVPQDELAKYYFDQLGHERSSNCWWVTLSGGNPCMHDLTALVESLNANGLWVAVETQGTLCPEWLHMCTNITVSPKGPGMGEIFEEDKFLHFVTAFSQHPGFNVKVVVFSAQDIEFARHINEIMCDNRLADRMYLSLGNPYPPGLDKEVHFVTNHDHFVDGDSALKLQLLQSYNLLCEDLLQIPHMANVRFLPQLHVLTWANKQQV